MKLLNGRIGLKEGFYNFLTSNKHAFIFVLLLAKKTIKLLPQLPVLLIVIIFIFNLFKSNRLLNNNKRIIKSNFLAIRFVRAIYVKSFLNSFNETL